MKKQVTFVEQEMKLVANFGQTHRVSDGGFERGYEQGVAVGYKDGHSQGVIEGYENGHSIGVTEGYQNGHTVGYENGHSAGLQEGYNNGYQVGYDKGVDFVEKQVEEIENGSY